MAKKSKGNGRAAPVYAAYVFKDKDPAIDELRGVIERHHGHNVHGKDLAGITKDGGPSTSCMRAWFFGDTKRPNNSTLEAAGRAMGYKRVWQRLRPNR